MAHPLSEDIDDIEASGALGRSPVYARLLRYLAVATEADRAVSEIEIATEVFSKGGDFDSNQDSMVRVYMHNLRQRLDRYYESKAVTGKARITIPRGEYRLTYQPLEIEGPATHLPTNRRVVYALSLLLLISLSALVMVTYQGRNPAIERVADNPIWAPLLESELPLLIVVGDYYIFAELDTDGNIKRMVREFDINSEKDLGQLMSFDPERPYDYMNLDLTYLPQSTAFALKDILAVVYSSDRAVSMLPASKLRVADLQTNNIIYVGYLSGLGILEKYVFAASSLRLGETYDELVHHQTQAYFFSNAGIPERTVYRDFGFLSSFRGPAANNRISVIAGTRDSGLIEMAQIVSTEAVEGISESLSTVERFPDAYEALFEVAGSDRMSLDASLVHHAVLEGTRIWSNHQNLPIRAPGR